MRRKGKRKGKKAKKNPYLVISGDWNEWEVREFSMIDGVEVVSEDSRNRLTLIFSNNIYPIREVQNIIYRSDKRLMFLFRGTQRFEEFDKLHIN